MWAVTYNKTSRMSKSKIKTKVSISMENYEQHTIEILDSIFESRVDSSCDVSLSSSDGQLFFCHRLVLCFNSNFLRKILSDVPVLAQPVICIPDIDGEILELVLRFIYTGNHYCTIYSMPYVYVNIYFHFLYTFFFCLLTYFADVSCFVSSLDQVSSCVA